MAMRTFTSFNALASANTTREHSDMSPFNKRTTNDDHSPIECVVKMDKGGEPILFYIDEYGLYTYCTASEGHGGGSPSGNTGVMEYYQSLCPPRTDEEKAACDKWFRQYEAIGECSVPLVRKQKFAHKGRQYKPL